jgi:hypothetical protein
MLIRGRIRARQRPIGHRWFVDGIATDHGDIPLVRLPCWRLGNVLLDLRLYLDPKPPADDRRTCAVPEASNPLGIGAQ